MRRSENILCRLGDSEASKLCKGRPGPYVCANLSNIIHSVSIR